MLKERMERALKSASDLADAFAAMPPSMHKVAAAQEIFGGSQWQDQLERLERYRIKRLPAGHSGGERK